MDDILRNLEQGEFEKIHSGKVRDSYRYDDKHRIVVVSDRLSCFDKILSSTFSGKGALLNQLSAKWFEWTQHIVPNHFVKVLAPQTYESRLMSKLNFKRAAISREEQGIYICRVTNNVGNNEWRSLCRYDGYFCFLCIQHWRSLSCD